VRHPDRRPAGQVALVVPALGVALRERVVLAEVPGAAEQGAAGLPLGDERLAARLVDQQRRRLPRDRGLRLRVRGGGQREQSQGCQKQAQEAPQRNGSVRWVNEDDCYRARDRPPAGPSCAGTPVRRPRSAARHMNRRFALIQALVSLVALAAVVWWAAKQESPKFPSGSTAIAWLVAAVVLYAVATLLRGERWHWILQVTGVRTQRSDCYALTTVGYMGNNVLPARAGEALKVVLVSQRC
jgi:Lysylphosphatidylglycerol synthase TM region